MYRNALLFVTLLLPLAASAQTDSRVEFVRSLYSRAFDKASGSDTKTTIDSVQDSLLERIDLTIYDYIPAGEATEQFKARKFSFDHSVGVISELLKIGMSKDGPGDGILNDIRLADEAENENGKMKNGVVWTVRIPEKLAEKADGYRKITFVIFLVDKNAKFAKSTSPPDWKVFGITKVASKEPG